jgi:Mn2+/Fe2+ NRAMP family transporter
MLSFDIPFALVPLVMLTSRSGVMGATSTGAAPRSRLGLRHRDHRV